MQHSAFKSNTDMMELVLPASLEPEEIACAQEIAKELDLKTELVRFHFLELCYSKPQS